ncbi:MAG: hypothetical protein ABEL51_01215 [Salinibacter sp.]
MTDQKPVIETDHGQIPLDDLPEILPGLPRIMAELSDRFWILYYAAERGNWDLAQYQVTVARSLLHAAGLTSSEALTDKLESFSRSHLSAIADSIEEQDLSTFKDVFNRAIESANQFHKATGVPYIHWTLPSYPPEHLKLSHQQE